MPRMNLTEDEAQYIEAVRRKNTAAIAHNRAIDLCINLVTDNRDAFEIDAQYNELLLAMGNLKEPVRP